MPTFFEKKLSVGEKEISRQEEDVLMWWRQHKSKYPNLARRARSAITIILLANELWFLTNGDALSV